MRWSDSQLDPTPLRATNRPFMHRRSGSGLDSEGRERKRGLATRADPYATSQSRMYLLTVRSARACGPSPGRHLSSWRRSVGTAGRVDRGNGAGQGDPFTEEGQEDLKS
jgi:hypothetical protein